MDLLDDIDARVVVDVRIYDQNVRDVLLDSGSQLVPASGGDERVLRAKNDFEMRELLTG